MKVFGILLVFLGFWKRLMDWVLGGGERTGSQGTSNLVFFFVLVVGWGRTEIKLG